MKNVAKIKKRIVCVVGPTASGKTRLAVELAKKFDGEIISADSRQVYKKLDIGTGKDLNEYEDIKYHMIDIAEPEENITLFDWLEGARAKIDEIIEQGKLPIITGGTGLYVQALIEGFSQEKTKTSIDNKKTYSREELDNKTLSELKEIFLKNKIEDSNIDINNPRRLIRAIEKAQKGIISLKNKPDFEALQIGITLPRPVLYSKIDKRVDQRFGEGMLEEVRGLIQSGVDPKWLDRLGLEYRVISKYLTSNSKDFAKMSQDLKWKIHAYARRQTTWFKRFEEIVWVKDSDEAKSVVKNFLEN